MGIRRRRKKVNTILTTIDRRLKSVELQRVPRVVKDGTITKKMLSKEVKIALDTGEDASTNNPGTSTPDKPPTFKTNPYTNIVKIIYRGYNEVGTANDRDRARVYFETDPGFNVGDKIKFASLTGSLDVPTKTVEYTVKEVLEVDGYHTIVYYPGRATIVNGPKTYDKGWRVKAANVSVTGAIVSGTTTTYKYGQIILDLKDTTPSTDDDYKWGPTWPAGIATTAGLHFTGGGFEVGDLINLEGLGTIFDGTHKITFREKVGYKLTLQFEFSTYPTAPVTLPNSSGAVRGAAGRFLRDGETWTDTSVEPAITWVWDDARQRWWNAADGGTLPEGVVVDDGIPPSPPTNLSGTSEGYAVGNKSYSKVALSWTAPTTNSNGTNISDLKGYAVYYRYNTQDEWTFEADVVGATSYTISELQSSRNVYFSVKAYDLTRNMSSYATPLEVLTVAGSSGLLAPSTPVTSSKLGVIRVTWDGLDATGATPPADLLSHIQVHWSTTSGFTPSASTNKGRLSSKSDVYLDSELSYNTNYYFKFVFVDIHDKTSAVSAEKLATITPLVNTDLIENSLTRWPFGPSTINVNSLATGSISATTLVSGSDADGTAVRVVDKIAAGTIGATSIAANSVVAGKLAVNAVTADNIAALSISAGKIQANQITADKINVGSIAAAVVTSTYVTGEVISGTKIVQFTAPNSSYNKVVMGYTDPTSGNFSGVGLSLYSLESRNDDVTYDSFGNVTEYHNPSGFSGYLGTWGIGGLELATHFSYSYFDMNRGSLSSGNGFDINMVTNGNISLTASDPVSSPSSGYIYTSAKRFTHAGAFTVDSASTSAFRVLNPNNATVYGLSWNGSAQTTTNGTITGRFFIDPGATNVRGLHVDGTVAYYGTPTILSDRSLKFDISSLNLDVAELESRLFLTDIVRYKYKQTDGTEDPTVEYTYGVIAEDIEAAGLHTVTKYEEGQLVGVDYSMFGLLLVPIVKKLREEVDALKRELGRS